MAIGHDLFQIDFKGNIARLRLRQRAQSPGSQGLVQRGVF